MPIRGVVVDASDTLIHGGTPVAGVDELWNLCQRLDLRIIVATNQPSELSRLKAQGYIPDYEAYPSRMHINKPSPQFILRPAADLGIQANELVYIGDNDRTDAFCASNAKVPYLRAEWAVPHGQNGRYGIPIPTLAGAARYIETFMTKEYPFYWTVDGQDHSQRRFTYRAVIDNKTIDPQQNVIKQAAVDVLKRGQIRHREFFLHHLLTSLYLSGLIGSLDVWTTYPGHTQGSVGHNVLSGFIDTVSPQFRDKYEPLFVRHTAAPSSREIRMSRQRPRFETQVQTVMLNPLHRTKIIGRQVLVLDDFTTGSFSFEWARNLLLAGGASDVVCVAMGKFGNTSTFITPKEGIDVLPFEPSQLTDADFDFAMRLSSLEDAASGELQHSFDMFRTHSPWIV